MLTSVYKPKLIQIGKEAAEFTCLNVYLQGGDHPPSLLCYSPVLDRSWALSSLPMA